MANPYDYRPHKEAFANGYEAGRNEWRYNPPDFRIDAVANEAYNKGWKEGWNDRKQTLENVNNG